MSKIEDRVVAMKFDNKQFEQGIAQTSASLAKFNQSLNFDKAAASADKLGNVKMEGIRGALDTIKEKFSALDVVAITALTNVTNKAIDAGGRILKALTLDPIMDGFREYETQMGAVQTILANTLKEGTNVQTVNKYLDDLNTYADKTIYNFTEMTKNIGTFTAAGVKLEPATKAIKGIANLAALSGSNSQQASTAMYQLSQALAAGRVGLQDWNSVVNAGMGGEQFQNLLKDTALAMGAVDKLDKKSKNLFKNGSFRDSLKGGWLSSDVLTQALDVMTGSMTKADLMAKGFTESQAEYYEKLGQTAFKAATEVKTVTQLFDTLKEAVGSGWAQSFRIVLGDFEEAKELFTWLNNYFSPVIDGMSNARNLMLQTWKDAGGRTAMVQTLKNILEGIGNILGPIQNAWQTVFPPAKAGEALAGISKALEYLTSKLKPSGETAAKLQRIFTGLFSILGIVSDLVGAVGQAFGAFLREIIDLLPKGHGGILEWIAGLADWVTNLRNSIREGDVFMNAIRGARQAIVDFGTAAMEKLAPVAEALGAFFSSTSDKFAALKDDLIPKAQETVEGVNEQLAKIGSDTAQGAEGFKNETLERVSAFAGKVQSVAEKIGAWLQKAWEKVKEFGGHLANFFKSGDKELGMNQFLAALNLTMGAGIGAMLIALVHNLAGVTRKVKKGIGEVSDIVKKFGAVMDAVKDHLKALTGEVKARTLLLIAAALGVLAASVALLAMVDPVKLTVGLTAISVLLAEVFGMMAWYSKFNKDNGLGGLAQAAVGMILMATAITILAGAVRKMGELDWWTLTKGLLATKSLLKALTKVMKDMVRNTKGMVTGAAALVIFGVAIRVLAESVKVLGNMKLGALAKGMIAFTAILTLVLAFVENFDSQMSMEAGVAITALALGILIMVKAVEKFGGMDLGVLTQGLISVTALLVALGAFIRIAGNGKAAAQSGLAILALAVSMERLAAAVEKFGTMDPDVIKQGLLSLMIVMLAVGGTLERLKKKALYGGAGFALVAVGVLAVAHAVKTLGEMDVDKVTVGVTALTVMLMSMSLALAIMAKTKVKPGVAAALILLATALGMLVPTILLLGAAGWVTVTIGIIALVAALAILGGAAKLLEPVIPAMTGLALALMGFAAAVAIAGAGITLLAIGLGMLGVSGAAGLSVLTAAITSLISMIPYLMEQLGMGLVKIAEVIINNQEPIRGAMATLIGALINAITENIPRLIELAVVAIESMCDALIRTVPKIVDTAFKLVVAFLTSLRDNIGKIVDVASEAIYNFLKALADNIGRIIDGAFKFAIAFINGLAKAIDENHNTLFEAIGRLVQAIFKALVDGVGAGLNGIRDVLIGIGKAIVDGIWKGITGAAGWFKRKVEDFFGGIVNGVKGVLGIKSPSRVFAEIGGYAIQGFSKGFEDGAPGAQDTVNGVSQELVDAVNECFKGMSFDDIDLTTRPEITPVLNLDDVRKDAKMLSSVFGSTPIPVSARNAQYEYGRTQAPPPEPTKSEEPVSKVTNVHFEQHNHSPESLDAMTIYRNTQNQLRQIREADLELQL